MGFSSAELRQRAKLPKMKAKAKTERLAIEYFQRTALKATFFAGAQSRC